MMISKITIRAYEGAEFELTMDEAETLYGELRTLFCGKEPVPPTPNAPVTTTAVPYQTC